MNTQELADRSATQLRRLMADGELSPVQLAEACLRRVEQHNKTLNAICTLSERVLEDAREAEQTLTSGRDPGLLCGLPVGIKDVTPTAGLRTTYGSKLYADHIPDFDALVVQRLKAQGAIVLGKTNVPEFAAGGHTYNPIFGRTCNPWNPGLSAGGSTGGGAAALASGMITLAEGTDLGGSLRMPASFCGVVGLRPSLGRVPTHPTQFVWDSLAVTGPMARTAEDVALMLQAVSGPDLICPWNSSGTDQDFLQAFASPLPKALKLAYCADIAGIGIGSEIEAVCRDGAFEMSKSGCVVEETQLDLSFGKDAFLALRGLWMVVHHFGRLDKRQEMGADLRANIELGLQVTTRELAAAEQVRGAIRRRFQNFFGKFDYLLTPCMAVSPFPIEETYPRTVGGKPMSSYVDWFAPTFLLSLTGLPVVTVPCGLDPNHLPVGLQIVGPPEGEGPLLALAQRVQEARPIGLPPL